MPFPAPIAEIYTVRIARVLNGEPKIYWTEDSPPNRHLAYRFSIVMRSGKSEGNTLDVMTQDDDERSVVVNSISGIMPGDKAEFV